MSYLNTRKFGEDNNWNTPSGVWNKVIEFIPKDKTVWMPFYNDGYAGEYLRGKGFNIIHENVDFFESDKGDIVIDNPPYKDKNIVKIKDKIMKRLIELDKPFMLLLPSTTIQTQYFDSLHNEHFQLLIPREKYNFEKFVGDKTKCPFYTLWVCYKMGFERDYYII